MPDPSLNAYLAKHYLDGAKAEAILARDGTDGERKRKRKKVKPEQESASGSGFRLVDDSDETWKADRLDDDGALVVEDEGSTSKRKQSRWAKVGKSSGTGRDDVLQDGDLPQVADEQGMNLDANDQMSAERQLAANPAAGSSSSNSAIRAGLKTREEMRAERIERERKAAEEKEAKRSGQIQSTNEDEQKALQQAERERRQQETVYRDATGKRIDVQKEDEERRKKREEERKLEREKTDWNKGEAQLRNAREQRRREEEERNTSFARHADDTKMNAQLRKVERQNDPAARFLKNKEAHQARGPQKPVYKGHFPPNRFGIRPGYRWDGVERSNGFENKLFQRRNERARRKAEHQAWSQEDM
ncbi:uncharacterized protein FA14DRAFT_160317 [Meira miltonrushii]|uniref:Pre-mRNA-splicing factor CWC26 n=1 Tax=Meira miltonrushii TaxID=1280837 RepID=A0A316VHD7_9BASI|nr:uncharacterized protein FA14DRAFT_160317 [Meira miltonrushii]PWN34915.1 hypothetical protein FA14DRAFT_160317 [Meira miltonrushii]